MTLIESSERSAGSSKRGDSAPPERGLMVREPWASQILMGKKQWELRGIPTKIRGRLAIIRSGSGLVLGECQLVDCIGPLEFEALIGSGALSAMERDEIERAGMLPYLKPDGLASKTFAWVVAKPVLYSAPLAYNHPSGAITFVDLAKPGVLQCTEASSLKNGTTYSISQQLPLL